MGITPFIILLLAIPFWGLIEFISMKCKKKEVPSEIASPLKESLEEQIEKIPALE
jgi:hypothetical protein